MTEAKPKKSQFMDYVRIRNSGVTNMFDIRAVCEYSNTGLTRENCFYIMNHFMELADEYNVEV
jgi:hypothetical protein